MIHTDITKNVAKYVKDIGVNLSELSRKAEIPYSSLYASLAEGGRGRELRAKELVSICFVLRINPMNFVDKKDKE
ncbi:hypothetical protein [Acetivibrio ethanolgignens]|uniref:HTH cro/C1-type domain-containing protein n=1 Tax=Acetivibrio ethanolgignens TaxID=290052 RepID=A0A0V8QJJ9_9FIRM|nr:hypothetical protein [Acetivibrio ethanolgignens]KSV60281.1 hypothetical protein ASU35_05875 [Acetivibrio ethanolgignens]